VAAYGLVLNDRRIVLCRISDELPEHSGKWTLPGGGIEFGEHPVDAMVREVREETGLVVRPTTLAGIDSVRIEREDRSFRRQPARSPTLQGVEAKRRARQRSRAM
jgi:ADP-ribose pyrophosphatase YjhB (NUDIX family)